MDSPFRIIFLNFPVKEKNEVLSDLENSSVQLLQQKLVLFYMSDNGDDERLKLRRIFATYEQDTPVIIFSPDSSVAQLAWDVNAYHFVNLSIANWRDVLRFALKKTYRATYQESCNEVTFHSQTETHHVRVDRISFIQAQGNYSQIFFLDKTNLLLTRQLGKLEKEVVDFPCLYRVNKSVIINLNSIHAVKGNMVVMKNQEALRFSKNSHVGADLKSKLLWK